MRFKIIDGPISDVTSWECNGRGGYWSYPGRSVRGRDVLGMLRGMAENPNARRIVIGSEVYPLDLDRMPVIASALGLPDPSSETA